MVTRLDPRGVRLVFCSIILYWDRVFFEYFSVSMLIITITSNFHFLIHSLRINGEGSDTNNSLNKPQREKRRFLALGKPTASASKADCSIPISHHNPVPPTLNFSLHDKRTTENGCHLWNYMLAEMKGLLSSHVCSVQIKNGTL